MILNVVVIDPCVLAGDESRQIGSVGSDDKNGSESPKILHYFARPRFGGFRFHSVTEQHREYHSETRSQGVVLLPFPAPGVKAERAVPLEQRHRHGCEICTDEDGEPHRSIKGFKKSQHAGLPGSVRIKHRKAGEEVRVGEVDDFLSRACDAEGSHSKVSRVVDEVLDDAGPRLVLPLAVLFVLYNVQREVEVQIAGQLVEQVYRQAPAALNTVQTTGVSQTTLIRCDGTEDMLLILLFGGQVQARGIRYALAIILVRRLGHHERLHGVGHHPVSLPPFRGRLETLGVSWPDDAKRTNLSALHTANILPHLLAAVEDKIAHSEGGDVHVAIIVKLHLSSKSVHDSLSECAATVRIPSSKVVSEFFNNLLFWLLDCLIVSSLLSRSSVRTIIN